MEKEKRKKEKKKSAKFSGLKSRIAKLVPAKKILAIEVSDKQLLGAVVTCKGKSFAVQDFFSVNRSNSGDDLPDPENIKEIMERLKYPAGPVVLSSPLARAVHISVNRTRVKKLNDYQLAESLRWEIEPFTGISGANALVGVEKSVAGSDEITIVVEDEDEEIDVNVSAIEENVYRALKQIFKRAGLKLIRLYPPDVCFYMAGLCDKGTTEREAQQAVLDIGHDYANFTILKGVVPKQLNTFPMGTEVFKDLLAGEEMEDIQENLDFLLSQVPAPLPMILTGSGAVDPEISAYLDKKAEFGAVPILIKRQAKITDTGHDRMNAIYATVVGAAIRELMGKKQHSIGISDLIPLVPRLKQNSFVAPLAITVVLLLFLLGHYAVMRVQGDAHRAQIEELSAELKAKQSKRDNFDRAKKEFADLRSQISLIERKIKFVEGGSDENLIHLNRVLASFTRLPERITLQSIEQNGEKYTLIGTANTSEDIGYFAVELQKYKWCRAAVIQILEGREGDQTHFRIEVDTDGSS